MLCRTLWLVASLAVLCPAGAAQIVQDDFSDGDFTHNPPWFGDVDRFTIVPFEEGNALRSDGLAQNDTLFLATASSVAYGYWRFRFRHEVNLSNVNGARVFLVASGDDLTGEVQGYYVQFGTNNVNRIELWRQDGATHERTRIGESTPIVPGDANTVTVEVTRDEHDSWLVYANGQAVITGVVDSSYSQSTALGVWVKHNATGRDRFFFTDFFADPDPGDITPPFPTAVIPADMGAALLVAFNEPVVEGSVTPGAFEIDPEVGHPSTAALTDDPSVARLTFAAPLAEGAYSLHVAGVADSAGNVQPGATLPFDLLIDSDPPQLTAAEAVDAQTVRVTFDQPVAGCDASRYAIEPSVGTPAGITCATLETFDLHLSAPLAPQTIYVVTATGVADLHGHVQPSTSATFFYGTYDTPQARDIVINEIMYAPDDYPTNEYVELYNRSEDRIFDLSTLRFANATSPLRVITEQPTPLAPAGYAVLVRNPEAFRERFPGVPYLHVVAFPALLNGGDTAQLLTDAGETIDAVPYRPSWGGAGPSLERLDPNGPSNVAANWATSQDPRGGTPGELNSVYHPDVYPPTPLAAAPSNDGLVIVVDFDEPLDPASVTTDAFSLAPGPVIAAASYEEEDGFRAILDLATPLAPGDYVLHVVGIRDLVGNETDESIAFAFAPDLDPPFAVEVRALSSTEILVRYDEAVDPETALLPAHYSISAGYGHPAGVAFVGAFDDRVRLEMATPLAGPLTYQITITAVEDLHGNAMEQQEVSFFFGEPEPPGAHDVVINEVMYAPADVASNEYVELLNTSEKVIDLATLTLSDQTNEVPVASSTYLLAPGAIAVLVRNPGAFEQSFPETPYLHVSGFPTLLNGGDAVIIRHVEDGGRAVIDSVFYVPVWGGQGVALERRSPGGPSNSAGNWASSIDPRGGTPAEPNSVAPDTFPPEPLIVEVAPDGRSLTVFFDEPLDPATVQPAAFDISGVGPPLATAYLPDPDPAVELDLAAQLPAGPRTLTITGVADLLGNATAGATIPFTYTPDVTPPAIASVLAPDSVSVRVRFSEPVQPASGADPENYTITPAIGTPAGAAMDPAGDPRMVELALASPLATSTLYTLHVSGVTDLAGNVQAGDTAPFLLGDADVPAPGDIVINEIMFREAEGGTEYVELRNTTEKTFDLSGLTLSDEGAPRAISALPRLLPPAGIMAIARDLDALREHFGPDGAALRMTNLPNLRNSDDAVVLRHDGVTIDSVYYRATWHRPEIRDARGIALERLDPGLSSTDAGNWTSSLDPRGGTPGLPNSVEIPAGEAPVAAGITVTPSPFDADTGTVIRYRLAADAGVVRTRVFDGAGRHVRTLEDARLAGSATEGEVIWNGRDDAGRPLRVGIYIVLLEALDLVGARTEVYRAPVVLARAY